MIARVARSSATVLLLGETGTGKELAARALHAESDRAAKPFIPVNCAALPDALLESELFGHEPGAFTGASAQKKPGRFELAHGGTIFLDEIAETPPDVQVKLLRVLEDKEITPLGSTKPVACDVRIITATHRDLAGRVRSGSFRQDLYYRLNVFPIQLPPLRQRREDIPALVEHFVETVSAEMNLPAPEVSPEALAALQVYDFPGNIRELRNVIERACLLCTPPGSEERGAILREHLPPAVTGSGPAQATQGSPEASAGSLAGREKAAIIEALEQTGWNQTRAAERLGVTRDQLRYRVKKHGISRGR